MSTRAMAHEYMARGGNSTVPQGLDLFGIQHRRQLEMMREQNALNQSTLNLLHKQDLELEQAKEEHTKNIASSAQVTEQLKQKGIEDTPANRLRTASELTDMEFANARQQLSMQNQIGDIQSKALGAPGVQDAANIGARIKMSAIPPSMLGGSAKMGEVTTIPSLGGVNAPLNSDPGNIVLKGGGSSEMDTIMGGFPMKMPDGSIQMVGGRPVKQTRMTPGNVTTPQPPFTPADVRSLRTPNGASNTTMPANAMPWDIESQPPVPAAVASGGGLDAQPSPPTSPLAPQWPPRSGLIPGAYDTIGSGIKSNYQQYRDYISNPLWRLLFGGGQQAPTQLTTTPQY